MKKMIQRSSVLAMLVMSGFAMASGVTNNSLSQLMNLSGINKQVANIPAGITAGMQQSRKQGSPLTDEQFSKIEKIMTKAFQPSDISNTISSKVKSELTEAEAQELLSWYKSDLGKKVTKAEEKGSDPAAVQEMINQANTLMADKERVKYAKRIDQLVKATDLTVEFQKSTATAIFTSLSKAINPGQPVDMKAFEARLTEAEPKMRQQVEQMITLSYVYNYKELSASEMNKYIDFLQRPSTKKFNDTTISGMKKALQDSANTMGASLASIFTAKK